MSYGPPGGGAHFAYFSTREAAEARWAEIVGAARKLATEMDELPSSRRSLGFVSTDQGAPGWLTARFAPADAPVDEVRVVPRSILVRDGALRGLVRNWSRHLWAYGATVRVGERKFVWPLSIQPGEVAPFELRNWRGSAGPGHAEFSVIAEMSWHADPSRAFGDYGLSAGYSNLEQHRVVMSGQNAVRDVVGRWNTGLEQHRALMSGQGWERYGDVWTDAEAGRVSVGAFGWDHSVPLVVPESHPSLAHDIENLTVQDLRGYGAVLDRDGRVLEVGPAFVGHARLTSPPDSGLAFYDWHYTEVAEIRDGEPDSVGLLYWVFEELPEIPPEGPPPSESMLTVSFHDFDPLTGEYRRYVDHYGGFIAWIGAAHPERPVG